MSRRNKIALIFVSVVLAGVVALGAVGWKYYKAFFSPNVTRDAIIYLWPDYTFRQVDSLLQADSLVKDIGNFRVSAHLMKYSERIRPGRYALKAGMNSRALVGMLRSGRQAPVRLIINKKRTQEEFAGYIGSHLMLDSLSLIQLMRNDSALAAYGFNPENIMAMFLQNTYEMWWTTSARQFLDRMYNEYLDYWTSERLSLADKIGLSPIEVIILASIIEEETAMDDEKPTIAGLYLNRLRKSIPLQSDPTLKFAHRHFEWKRIYNRYKTIDSPYNTYRHKGLPPGPICIPQLSSIEAVLHAQKHDYLFMCARDDFSGYHSFARTNAEHERNRQRYIRALEERNIH